MKLYKHTNYDEYITIQRTHVANHVARLKKDNVSSNDYNELGWVKKVYLDNIVETLQKFIDLKDINLVLCHAVRCGYEVKYFRDIFGLDNVYSTDLSGDAFMFDRRNFYVQDFDVLPNEWKSKFDLIYSNSIDHSRDPINTLSVWEQELTTNGIMVVTFSLGERVTDCDCFALEYIDEIEELIQQTNLELLYKSEKYSDVNVFDAYLRRKHG